MSGKSKKLDRPFDKKILAKARKIAAQYEVIMSFEDGQWYGKGVEMPTVFGDGKTPNDCIGNTREAFVAAVAYLLETGQAVPTPSKEGKRTEQVNVRLTAEEKVILSAYAKSKGYRGLGDYLRASALNIKGAL
jgi:predicted RNase H-like HicB family nuclease